ncbi:hypothetical protein Q0601_12940 [Paracoccus onubensis]|uniref:hypothetical protein n=1 Tax=Paracoccus onubensis TaxID=1675788 RepID=UPI0027314306|nr:hypothetical protein [Paracoccus onubensis]MDP0928084.1 hypothetical protein [Paracoccus onubensis]
MAIGKGHFMRFESVGILAMLMLCAADRQAFAQTDPAVLIVGASMPAPLAMLEDKAAVVPADGIGDELAGGRADLIYIGAAPENGVGSLPDMLVELPADRPMMLVVNDCGWQERGVDPDQMQSALRDGSQVTIAVSDKAGNCDAEALAQSFAAAAVKEGASRREVLRKGGYRLSEATAVAATAPAGGLVISALPAESMRATGASPVILASADPNPVIASDTANDSVALAPESVATARRLGAPEPSIIVGDLAVLVAADSRGPLGMPYQAREEIRRRDPAMFNRLLGRGAFDPEGEQVAAAIQTELARMNCYNGGIDGAWGSGSASALRRYFEEAGAAQASTTPEIGLYRGMISREAVECPDIQPVAQATPSRNSGGGNTRSQPAPNAARAQAAAPEASASAQPTAPTTREINLRPGLLGVGSIR